MSFILAGRITENENRKECVVSNKALNILKGRKVHDIYIKCICIIFSCLRVCVFVCEKVPSLFTFQELSYFFCLFRNCTLTASMMDGTISALAKVDKSPN